MRKEYIIFVISLVFIGCVSFSSTVNLPIINDIEACGKTLDYHIVISMFGGTTDADKELVPYINKILPETFIKQKGFFDVQAENEMTISDDKPVYLIKGYIRSALNAAVQDALLTTINFSHSSEAVFSVFEVTGNAQLKRYDENMQTNILYYDTTNARKIYNGSVNIILKADYGAQANIPKFISDILTLAAKDLSIKICRWVYSSFSRDQ
ncbi:MAG: hypothetical protein JW874_12975 [Spirochaetales bacterium]|nr:hypothetical protein [Spirochaetales bacterium]